MATVSGTISKGIGDATANLKLQKDFFVAVGIDEKFLHHGTINVDISPLKFSIIRAEFELRDIEWKSGLKEDFRLVPLRISFLHKEHQGYLYNASHAPHSRGTMEVLAEHIPDVSYGKTIRLIVPDDQIELTA